MGCKMIGLHFDDCAPFFSAPVFENCQLSLSSFLECKLQGVVFSKCILDEADFTGADLTSANFEGSSLAKTVFENTNLSKADLRDAVHYQIDPNKNKLRKARFSLEGCQGLLVYFGVIID